MTIAPSVAPPKQALVTSDSDDAHPIDALRASLKHHEDAQKTTELSEDPHPAAALRKTLKPGDTVVRANEEVTDTSLDEGPAYDGKGGMGLAKGTANTYIIPGMDEMTPEEYRKALQKSVSDRQTRRHSSRSGVVGNRAALQYLDTLGWGGASSNWKKNEDDDEDDAHNG